MATPNRAFLKASLALWRRRERYRKQRHDHWQRLVDQARDKGHPRQTLINQRNHWSRLLRRARHMIKLREDQLGQGPTTMYDSTDLSQIPPDAPAVAGYVSGRWPTFSKLAGRFPRARLLSVATGSAYDAECLDVEPGDSTPARAPDWVKRQHARGIVRPVVYCSVSAASDVVNHLGAAGISRGQYRLWTAHFTGREHLCGPGCGFGMPTTADATQWTDRALGRNLDQSVCRPGFW